MRHFWTHAELNAAQCRRLDGERTVDIARDYGVSAKALVAALHRQGHPSGARWRLWTHRELSAAQGRLALGEPVAVVAQAFHATIDSLRNALTRHGYPAVQRPKRTYAQTRRLVRDYLRKRPATTAQVAFSLDRTHAATARILRWLRSEGVVRVRERLPGYGAAYLWELVA